MAKANDSIKNVEVQGIKLKVDVSRFTDQRFMYLVGKVSSVQKSLENASDDEREQLEKEVMVCYARMMDVLFNDDAFDVMDKLAGGGALEPDAWNSFVSEVMSEVGAKN